MDGQGYVPLSVIANFKRIKSLTEENMSIENLRYVCQQVKTVEFLLGPEGDDRLRRREGWRDFVLPIEERFESARTDGPTHSAEAYGRHVAPDQPGQHVSFPYGQMRSPPPNTSTINGNNAITSPVSYFAGTQGESQIAPYPGFRAEDMSSQHALRSPPLFYSGERQAALRSPPMQMHNPLDSMVNGHHRQGSRADAEDNAFPDERIVEVNVRMRPQPGSNTGAAPAEAATAADQSHQHQDGRNGADGGQVLLPNLRGGAASPPQ
jgi:hypothetical protein